MGRVVENSPRTGGRNGNRMGYLDRGWYEQPGKLIDPDGTTRDVIVSYTLSQHRGLVVEGMREAAGGRSVFVRDANTNPRMDVRTPSNRTASATASAYRQDGSRVESGVESNAGPDAGASQGDAHRLIRWIFFKDHNPHGEGDLPTGEVCVTFHCPNFIGKGYAGSDMIGYVDDFDQPWRCACGQWVKFTWSPTFAPVPDPRS